MPGFPLVVAKLRGERSASAGNVDEAIAQLRLNVNFERHLALCEIAMQANHQRAGGRRRAESAPFRGMQIPTDKQTIRIARGEEDAFRPVRFGQFRGRACGARRRDLGPLRRDCRWRRRHLRDETFAGALRSRLRRRVVAFQENRRNRRGQRTRRARFSFRLRFAFGLPFGSRARQNHRRWRSLRGRLCAGSFAR